MLLKKLNRKERDDQVRVWTKIVIAHFGKEGCMGVKGNVHGRSIDDSCKWECSEKTTETFSCPGLARCTQSAVSKPKKVYHKRSERV